jgi:hypothetical protein
MPRTRVDEGDASRSFGIPACFAWARGTILTSSRRTAVRVVCLMCPLPLSVIYRSAISRVYIVVCIYKPSY